MYPSVAVLGVWRGGFFVYCVGEGVGVGVGVGVGGNGGGGGSAKLQQDGAQAVVRVGEGRSRMSRTSEVK